jgi:hypothetical protein
LFNAEATACRDSICDDALFYEQEEAAAAAEAAAADTIKDVLPGGG